LILCSGVASFASREESEEMYSGVSLVPKDFFRKQIKAEGKQEGVNMRLYTRARSRLKENSLSNGALLWWGAVLLDELLAFVHGLRVFSSGAGEKM
jgi:hypothetical protein